MAPNGSESCTLASRTRRRSGGQYSALARTENVTGLRDLGRYGFNCEVDGQIALGERSATFRTIWHYATSAAAPRLVSAFPKL